MGLQWTLKYFFDAEVLYVTLDGSREVCSLLEIAKGNQVWVGHGISSIQTTIILIGANRMFYWLKSDIDFRHAFLIHIGKVQSYSL